MIGIAGAHRTGKSTLAQEFADRYDCEFLETSVSSVFEEMGLEVLSISHFPFNQRSRRVIEKCGFRYEGTLRKSAVLHDGSVCDEVCYSLLKEEYQRNKETYYPGGVK